MDKTIEKTKLNSEWHTLFIIDVPEKKEPLKIEQKSRKGKVKVIEPKDTYTITPAHKKYRIFIDDFMEFERGLHEMFNTLWEATDTDELELRINSNGGLVKEGQNFYNLIKNKFRGRCTTVLDSKGYSMGALTFCMGDKRVAMPQCDLMFHDYSSGASGNGQELESQIAHKAKHLRNFFREIIVKNNFLTSDEFDKMIIGKNYWMEVDEMCERGIATHVLFEGSEITAKEYLDKIKDK